MDIQTYKSKKEQLTKDYNESLKALASEFALANNPYQVGDIFTDHIGSIKVISVHVDYYGSADRIPYCFYKGTILKKDGTPSTKTDNKRDAYQINDVKRKG